jgi:hypothetical protein
VQKKKNKFSLQKVLFNGHQSFFFPGFCDEVKSGTYPLKHAAANVAFCDEAKLASIPLKHAAANVSVCDEAKLAIIITFKHAAAKNVAFCDEAKVASITLKHVATNVATPNRKDSAKCGYKPVSKVFLRISFNKREGAKNRSAF